MSGRSQNTSAVPKHMVCNPSRLSLRPDDQGPSETGQRTARSGPITSDAGSTSSPGLGASMGHIMRNVDNGIDPATRAFWNLTVVTQAVGDNGVTPALPSRDRIDPAGNCLHGPKHNHVYWLVDRPYVAQDPNASSFCVGDIFLDRQYSKAAIQGLPGFDSRKGPHICAGIVEKRGIIPARFCKKLTVNEARLYELATLRSALQANSEDWDAVDEELGRYIIGAGQRERAALETSGDSRAILIWKEEERYWNPRHPQYANAARPASR